MDVQEITKAIRKKLGVSGWDKHLDLFLDSVDFCQIITELKRKVEEDKQRFCPNLGKAFRFLEVSPVESVKTVMLIDHSYNTIENALGIPFTPFEQGGKTDFEGIPFYELDWFIQSIPGSKLLRSENRNINTYNWIKEGVILIPLSLTSRVEGKDHKKIWRPFIMRLIEVLNKHSFNIPWLLVGEDTFKYYEDIKSKYVRTISLKPPINDNQWTIWTNEILKSQGKSPVKWIA